MKEIRTWTIKDSAELYNIGGWSSGYFRINDAGHVEVTPSGPEGRSVDLHDLVLDLERRGLGLPLLMRFSDILHSRIKSLVGVSTKVSVLPPDAIERTLTGKARRVFDKRPK